MSTRTDARASTSGHPLAIWFAAGSATAAVTGGLSAALYIASVIGWLVEGRAPASGWLGIVMGVVVGGIFGGIGIGIQRRGSFLRIVAPLIALAQLMGSGLLAWVMVTLFDPSGSLR